jgi:hypothetical protein
VTAIIIEINNIVKCVVPSSLIATSNNVTLSLSIDNSNYFTNNNGDILTYEYIEIPVISSVSPLI